MTDGVQAVNSRAAPTVSEPPVHAPRMSDASDSSVRSRLAAGSPRTLLETRDLSKTKGAAFALSQGVTPDKPCEIRR